VCWHDIAYTFVNSWTAPTAPCNAAVYCNHSQWMLYQQSCTCTQSKSYCNGTANCTVGHDCVALLLLLLWQNAFNVNSVHKTTFSVSRATRNTDWIYCMCNFRSIKVSDYKALLCRGYLQPILQYRMYIHACSNSVTVRNTLPSMKKSTVEEQNWWIL
jgi:hypothetical protein